MTSPDEFARHRGDPVPRRHSRFSFADLGALVLVAAVLYTALPAWAASAGGRDVLRGQIEQLLDSQIRGHVTIGSLDRVDGDGVVGTNVIFYDEGGHVVIQADHVELEVDWGELMHGHVLSPRGHVHGGRVVLETIASGTLLIDRAFESAHPGPHGQPIGADVVRLERLAADGVEVVIRIHGAAEIRATHVSTICMVRAPENGSALFRADRIHAHLHLAAPVPVDLDIDNGHFHLDGASQQRARIDFPARVAGEPLHVVVVVRADAEQNMHVSTTLTPQSFGAVFLSGPLIAQALIADGMSSALDVTIGMP